MNSKETRPASIHLRKTADIINQIVKKHRQQNPKSARSCYITTNFIMLLVVQSIFPERFKQKLVCQAQVMPVKPKILHEKGSYISNLDPKKIYGITSTQANKHFKFFYEKLKEK